MRTLVCAVVLAGAVAPATAQEARATRAPDSDQTVDVARGTRLSINNFAGEVVLKTWDRDALRVAARHSSRSKVNIRTNPGVVSLSASSSMGPGSVDYEITAPSWMAVKVDGTYNYISIEGAQAEITANTVRGDISIKGGTGFVTAKSIEGAIVVDGAKGRINVGSVNESVRVLNASGDLVVETTNGDITLTGVDAKSIEVATVNGEVTFEGSFSGGRHRFATHNGDIVLALPESTNATFSVRTYNGTFRSALPVKGGDPAEARRGRRMLYTLGSGQAEVELETFGGDVRIVRPGSLRPPAR